MAGRSRGIGIDVGSFPGLSSALIAVTKCETSAPGTASQRRDFDSPHGLRPSTHPWDNPSTRNVSNRGSRYRHSACHRDRSASAALFKIRSTPSHSPHPLEGRGGRCPILLLMHDADRVPGIQLGRAACLTTLQCLPQQASCAIIPECHHRHRPSDPHRERSDCARGAGLPWRHQYGSAL